MYALILVVVVVDGGGGRAVGRLVEGAGLYHGIHFRAEYSFTHKQTMIKSTSENVYTPVQNFDENKCNEFISTSALPLYEDF